MLALLSLLAFAVFGRATAQPPPPCSLNGVVSPTNGACVCLPGWVGSSCNALSLSPAAPLNAVDQTYFHPSDGPKYPGSFTDNSWGISVSPDDDGQRWHAFMTEMEGNCSISSYSSASRILHMVAPSPSGPWAFSEVALGAFAHNPQVVRYVDGSWLLFHIGNAVPAWCNTTCPGHPANATCSGASHGTSVARALSPYGPWERLPYILPDNQTNPSAIVFPNGTIVVTARRWVGGVPFYVATNWSGPYVATPFAPVVLVPGTGPGPFSPNAPFDEDPFLYVNSLGTYHMITHRQPNGTNCVPTGTDVYDCRCGGGHMYAQDLIAGPWFVDQDMVYNCSLTVEGGGAAAEQLHARQRPTMLFPPSTDSGACPKLFTGASTDPVSQYYSSFTMVQEVNC